MKLFFIQISSICLIRKVTNTIFYVNFLQRFCFPSGRFFLLPGRIRFRAETDAESDSINNVFGMRILIAVLIIKKSN